MELFISVCKVIRSWGVQEWGLIAASISAVAAIISIFSPVLFRKERAKLMLEFGQRPSMISDGEGGYVDGPAETVVILTIRNLSQVPLHIFKTKIIADGSKKEMEVHFKEPSYVCGSYPRTTLSRLDPRRSAQTVFRRDCLKQSFYDFSGSNLKITASLTLESGKVFHSNRLSVLLAAE